MNEIIDKKIEIIVKNFYNDLYDIVEDNKLTEEETKKLLIINIGVLILQTFQSDTPIFLQTIKENYNIIIKKCGSIEKYIETTKHKKKNR